MKSWVDYWDSDHAIYVSERHKQLHADAIANDILRQVQRADAVILDHGCGEALYAETVAAGCGRLILCEAAPTVREKLTRRLRDHERIEVIRADGVLSIADASLDLVIANSLIQYLSREEFSELLSLWRRKLKPSGSLILADVIPPDVSPATDALALLRFAWRGGFLGAAIVGLAKTALSDYRRLRTRLGFATYREADIISLFQKHGFAGRRIFPNFGHNQSRMAFRASPV